MREYITDASIIAPGREGSQSGGAQENLALCGGAFLRCFLCVWSFATGVATRPRHLFPLIKPSLTGRAACDAQKSVRPVQCESQATAQTHQSPLNFGELRALALPPHEGAASAAV